MSKRNTVKLHQIFTVNNVKFNHTDGVRRGFAKMNNPWKEDMLFDMKLAREKLSEYCPQVTSMTPGILNSAQILDSLRTLRSCRKWDMLMDTTPQYEISYTTQYDEAILKDVENDYCAKHRGVPVNTPENLSSSTLVPPATGSGSCQSSFHQYDIPSDDEYDLTTENVA